MPQPGAVREDSVVNAGSGAPGPDALKILAIDTASGQCSVALWTGGQLLLRSVRTMREHAQLLLPMVDELLTEAGQTLRGLHGIAFGCGPGSFTGLRIAASVTQGLAAGADLPVLPVSDLRALAEAVRMQTVAARQQPAGRLLACMDARMGELYWALFENSAQPTGRAAGGEHLSGPSRLVDEVRSMLSAGEQVVAAAGMGLAAYPAIALELGIDASRCLPQAEPHAGDIARLALFDLGRGAQWQDPATAQPVYIRNSVAQAPL